MGWLVIPHQLGAAREGKAAQLCSDAVSAREARWELVSYTLGWEATAEFWQTPNLVACVWVLQQL